jgi:hypothetical protein
MTAEQAKNFTLKRLIFGDMLLNWCLGIIFTIFPLPVDRVLGQVSLLPPSIYRVIGVGFLLFAAWQTWVVIQGDIKPGGLIFASLMAEIPVVLLTIALLFMDFKLRPGWRIALWVGNVYMLLLGVWYVFVARKLTNQTSARDRRE